jgi:type IV secretion system protein VirD4
MTRLVPALLVGLGLGLALLSRPRLLLALAALAAALAGLGLVRWRLSRGPYGLPRRLPRRLRARAWVAWRERPFLGWGRGLIGHAVWAFGGREDSVAVVGPPRVGKTAGVLIPQALLWAGALVSTSTKPDVLRATAARRLELALRHGGGIHVYAPTATERVEGLVPVRWSPLAGCEAPRVAALRVQALLETAQVGRGVESADHWRSGAARILRPYFLAAAHHPLRPGDLAVVREWLAAHELREPAAILEALGGEAGRQWALELRGVQETPDKERGSFFSAAETALKATADPAVLRSCSGTDLDVERLLCTRSTLYIVSPSEHQQAVAPLIAALIESIVNAAYELERRGRLPCRLLLSLDEVANIAPLPSLESIVSQGAGQGVLVCWAAQSLAQLRHRYGEHAAEAIWSASRAKVVFGGLGDPRALEQLSRLVGEHQVEVRERTGQPGAAPVVRREWRPQLSPAELRRFPAGWALLVCGEQEPVALRLPVAARCWRLRRALRPWPAPVAVPEPVGAAPVPGREPRVVVDERALAWAAREAEGAELEEVVRAD